MSASAMAGSGKLTIQNGGQLTMAGQNFGVNVGNNQQGSGTLLVQTGGTLTASSLNVANQANSTGTVDIIGTASGPQTVVNLTGPASNTDVRNPLGVGWGTGTINVYNGAVVNGGITGGVPNPNCVSNLCNVFIGNAAGSTATLKLTDPGTTMSLAGGFFLGGAAVVTQANGGYDFGTAGATTHATMQVLNGATLNTYQSTVSFGPGGTVPTGSEHTIANVAVDGANSVWNITRNPVTNAQATLNLATHANATATIDVTNGGRLAITGGQVADATILPGIGMGAGTSTINVKSGGALVIGGYTGYINVGVNGGTALLDIASGGQVNGTGPNGLAFMNVGRTNGSHGTVNVDGLGSSLTLSGVGGTGTGAGSENQGAFLTIGRESGGVGAVNVTNGGSILIRDAGQNATVGGPGMNIGRDTGSEGHLVVSGTGSSLTVLSTGLLSQNPEISVGRNGTGTMLVEGGANVAVDAGDPATRSRNFSVGRNPGSNGTLTVTTGSEISASVFLVGNNSTGAGPIGGTGTATIDNARCESTVSTSTRMRTAAAFAWVAARQCRHAEPEERGALILDTASTVDIPWRHQRRARRQRHDQHVRRLEHQLRRHRRDAVGQYRTQRHRALHDDRRRRDMTLTLPDDGSIVLGKARAVERRVVMDAAARRQLAHRHRLPDSREQRAGPRHDDGRHAGVHALDPDHHVLPRGRQQWLGGHLLAKRRRGERRRWPDPRMAGRKQWYATCSTGGNAERHEHVGRRPGHRPSSSTATPGSARSHNVTGNLIVAGDTTSNGSSYTITGNNARTNINFAPGGVGPTDPPGSNGIDPITTPDLVPRPTARWGSASAE